MSLYVRIAWRCLLPCAVIGAVCATAPAEDHVLAIDGPYLPPPDKRIEATDAVSDNFEFESLAPSESAYSRTAAFPAADAGEMDVAQAPVDSHDAVPSYSPPPTPPVVHDAQVTAAAHEASLKPSFKPVAGVQADADRRLLKPSFSATQDSRVGIDNPPAKRSLLPQVPAGATVTTIGAMSLVVGLFLVSIWLVKRGMPKSAMALPEEVVSVLGRRPLVGRQSMQLLRVGNKLVLLMVTPDGTEAITEVNDPAEVDRLLGLCQQTTPSSSSAEFQHVLDQLAREPGGPGFLDADTDQVPAYRGYAG